MEIIIDKLKNFKYSIKERQIGLKSKSISGSNVISLNDASGNNAISFEIKGNSIQETRIGKNIWNSELAQGALTFANGTFMESGNYAYNVQKIPVKEGKTYVLSAKCYTSMGQCGFIFFKDDVFVSSLITTEMTVTIPSGVNQLVYDFYNWDGLDISTISDIQFEEGTEATEYVEFDGYEPSPSPEFPSEIENVSGKNEFNINATPTWNGEQVNYTVNNNSLRVYGLWYVAYLLDVKPNTNYNLSFIRKLTTVAGNTGVVAIWASDKKTQISTINTTYGGTFNTGDNNQIYIMFYCSNNTSWGDVTFENIQLEKGSIARGYTPYNHIEIKSIGKNLLPNTANSGSTNGLKFTVNSNGSIHITGTSTARTLFSLNVDKPITLKANAIYTFSKQGDSQYVEAYVRKVSAAEIVTSMAGTNTYKRFTNTCLEPVTAYIAIPANITLDVTITLQLSEGSDVPEYEPYKESIVTFPLAEGQKLMLNSSLEVDGIHHKRGQIVLDGTEEYTLQSINSYNIANFTYWHNMNISSNEVMSNRFVRQTTLIAETETEGILFQNNNLFLRISADKISTVEQLKAWLSENPVIVEYELAEEEIVPYTEEQQEAYNKLKTLTMCKGVNNIEVSSNIEPSETSIEYYSDEVVSLDNYKFEVKEI